MSIADELVNINGLANEMQMMGVVLSHVNVRCLEDFNARSAASCRLSYYKPLYFLYQLSCYV